MKTKFTKNNNKLEEIDNSLNKKAFLFDDEKSKKFWIIDYSGITLSLNYGKTGSIGRFQTKEFESEEKCIKQAEKLIKSKIKKGYIEDESFDFKKLIYFDEPEYTYGISPKTSHPNFVEHFKSAFYYDCSEEDSPFGSDEGNDALKEIEENYRKNKNLNFISFPKFLIENIWDMEYIKCDTLDKDILEEVSENYSVDFDQSLMITYSIAFAQIKITGKIDKELKENTLIAMKQFLIVHDYKSEFFDKMIEDLSSFEYVN